MHFLQLAQLLPDSKISHMRLPNEVIGQPSSKESTQAISLLVDIENGQHTATDVADSSLLCWSGICRSAIIKEKLATRTGFQEAAFPALLLDEPLEDLL